MAIWRFFTYRSVEKSPEKLKMFLKFSKIFENFLKISRSEIFKTAADCCISKSAVLADLEAPFIIINLPVVWGARPV